MKAVSKFDFKKINKWVKEYDATELVTYLDPVYIRQQLEKPLETNAAWFPLVNVEAMTVDEYKRKLIIHYSFRPSPFGDVLVASTRKGVCYMGFTDDHSIYELERRFPYASYVSKKDRYQDNAFSIFNRQGQNEEPIQLHLKGTPFQLQVWKQLIQIPFGRLVTYSSLVDDPKKSRAAGTAVGDNPVGYLIPCHRVVRSTGDFGHYYWGTDRKAALISWEAALSGKKYARQEMLFNQQPVE